MKQGLIRDMVPVKKVPDTHGASLSRVQILTIMNGLGNLGNFAEQFVDNFPHVVRQSRT
jgi:hypothetical protein